MNPTSSPPRYPPDRAVPFDLSPLLAELRRDQPICKVTLVDGGQAWLVTRHEEACVVLRDRRFSADSTRPGFPALFGANRMSDRERPGIARMDDPRHGTIRRMLTPEFLPRGMAKLRPTVQRVVDGQVDRLLAAGPPADLFATFALPIPSIMIAALLGVPSEDLPFFRDRTHVLNAAKATPEEVRAADVDIFAYLDRLVTRRRREAGDDLISKLVVEQLLPGRISQDELVNVARTMVVGGHLSTSSQMAMSLLSLLEEPERYRSLREHPETVSDLLEELLRFHSVLPSIPRVAKEDVTIGGTLIRAGEGVVVSLPSANRDEGAFPHADVIDYDRDARRHLAFGHGPHKCLGRPLARVEMEVALVTLARRVPTLRLAVPIHQLPFRTDMHVYGVHELPVTW